jgi:dihydropyrimidinase
MSGLDVIIRGGTVVTASDTFQCDVGIRDGRVAVLGRELGPAGKAIDATGKLVLPGGIDSHVHFSQPSGPDIVMADDFESGTRSAAFGGNTTVLPFCLQEKGHSLREAVNRYHRLAGGNCYVDVSFSPDHFGSDRAGARAGAAGSDPGRLHLLQSVHDL